MKAIELRSDTFTTPSAAMRAAMSTAVVGDDVYDEDPTVNRLQTRVAELMGHEGAIFFPTATMSNLAACMAHCDGGNMNEVIIGDISHQSMFEVGNLSTVGRIFPRLVPTDVTTGALPVADLRRSVIGLDVHCTVPKVLVLENTHCFLGGKVLPLDYLKEVRRWALDARDNDRALALKMHCDGARLWNASAASGVPMATYGQQFDSVSVCLSKGMGCPAGSMLVGSRSNGFLGRARHIRKMLGGGMRQVGVLAAAAMVALDASYPQQLMADHAKAKVLFDGLRDLPLAQIEPPQTNMILLNTGKMGHGKAPLLAAAAKRRGVRLSLNDNDCARAVTHVDVSLADCEQAVEAVREAWLEVAARSF